MDVAVVGLYLAAMIAFGFWGKRRATTQSDFLVAGRRLGPLLYSGTMAAIVLGGASTIGGVGLGYEYGLSGMWLVVAIGTGILALSLLIAGRIQRLGVYTVSQMLELRYGPGSSVLSGVVMFGYTLMLSVTSTIAYATIFGALLDLGRVPSIVVGGAVVVLYSTLGGMWSITLTDFVQFVIKTVGIFFVLLPVVVLEAGGFGGLADGLPADALSLTTIGGGTIVTYFVVYTFGLLIGQDIWQRVFTARSPGVARWAGTAAGVYCLLYGVAGAVIGMAARVVLPALDARDDAFAAVVEATMPALLAGLVLAAALAAVMSTSSGALIATATVFSQDIVARLRGRDPEAGSEHEHVRSNRLYVAGFGVVMIAIACVLQDVVAALTIAYDILVGGLLVAILGGLVWRRGTNVGALVSMAAGTLATLVTMVVVGDIYANEPIYYGLAAALAGYLAGSLASRPTDPQVLATWDRRLTGGPAARTPSATP
ncbi:solute:Na+ symporter, SSS family [Geodermatophilus dictyosporus]|uniref:Solute:Na+ symporter, SSS family n=1 Tax=Geodermatophilus dictyosporus TaxID=1523247 RepID=A0A1I5T4L7_9ACTN|nr:sodium:solute symporter [Geodermatophilus dictyosporus]SFP77898.1 solute:Na+ symporter, SSS family [Geodermatophilus dictyosporus]